jgi:hypothetical protein
MIESRLNSEGYSMPFNPVCAVSTTPPPSEALELGDEPVQLRRLADATEAHLRHTIGRNRTGHRGPKESTKISHRAMSSCTAREGFPPN